MSESSLKNVDQPRVAFAVRLKQWGEFAVEAVIRLMGLSTIGFVILILAFLLYEGAPLFWQVPLGSLLDTRCIPRLATMASCR